MKDLILQFLNETYYNNLLPPRKATDKEFYINEDLIGKRIWIHTNRSNRSEGRNGMIGIYNSSVNGNRTGKAFGYSNEIYLGDKVYFQTSDSGAKRIQSGGSRGLIAGVSGVVKPLSNYNGGGVEIDYSPFVGHFYPKSDKSIVITSADSVYFLATEEGKYIMKASGINE